MALAHDHHAAHAGGDGSDDTAATAWSDLPPLEAPVTEAGTAHAAGWVVAAGGFSYASQAATNATQLLAWPAGGTSWEALPDMPTPRHALAAAHFPALGPDTAVFVAGVLGTYVDDDGVQRTSLTNVVEALDLDGKAWLSPNALPPLPLALESPAAAALPAGALYNGGSLVVVGGFGYQANGAYFYSQATYLLSTSADAPTGWSWTKGPDFPWARSGLGCAALASGVLCFGGGETDPAYANAAFFDGEAWTPVAPMNEARNWVGATAAAYADSPCGEAAYAVGGYCCSAKCFFDPIASVERFTYLPTAPAPALANGSAGADAAGAFDVVGQSSGVLSGYWEEASPLPSPRAALGCAALGDKSGSGSNATQSVLAIGGDAGHTGSVLGAVGP